MQRRFKQSCLFALSLSVLFISSLFAQTRQPSAQRWEYQSINCDTNELNKLGDEGWELVAVITNGGGYCGGYLLKHQKPADAPKYTDPTKRPAPPPEAPTCNLTFAQAPTFRGIRLGMSVKDVLSLFPGSEENAGIKKRLEYATIPQGGYGLTDFRIYASFYQNVKEVKGLFADVDSYGFSIFDGRLVAFHVGFSSRPEMNWEKGLWQKKLSEAFRLPVTDKWGNPEDNPGNTLQCEGFSVSANGGQNPDFLVTERTTPSVYDIAGQRGRAAKEKRREEFKINP